MIFELSRSERNKYVYLDDAKNLCFGNHMHLSFEFIFVQEGELICTLTKKEYILHKNDAILIPPNRIHRFHTPISSKNKTLIFSSDFVPAFYKEMKNMEFTRPVFIFDAPQILEKINKQDIFLCKAYLYYICGLAYANCKPEELKSGNELLVQKIALYLQENFDKNIQLDTLARELNYNRCYLSSFINDNFSMNLRSVLNGYRIEYARQLMDEDQNLTAAEISELCGFETTRSFNRAFLKIIGCSPRDYKNSFKLKFSTK